MASTESVSQDITLALPALSQIPGGTYSLGAPVKDGNVNVGFHGKPDSFARLRLVATEDEIQIAREDGQAIQIDSGVIQQASDLTVHTGRAKVFLEPVPDIRIRNVDGQWTTDGVNVTSKLGLVRFAAKASEAAIKKSKETQHKLAS